MLYSLLEKTVKLFPNNIVLCTDGYQCTYQELNQNVKCIAKGLLSKGLKKGDRLASYLHNCPEAIPLVFACFKIGVSVVMLHPKLRKHEIFLILQESQPKIFVTQTDLYENNVKELTDQFPGITDYYLIDLELQKNDKMLSHFSSLILKNDIEECEEYEINGEDEAAIFDTSGSTSKSKSVLMSHQSLMTTVTSSYPWNFNEQSRFLLTSSMNISFGFICIILQAIQQGACIYYFSTNLSFNDYIKKIVQLLYEEKITVLSVTPTTWSHVLDELKKQNKGKVFLSFCMVSGEKLPQSLLEETKKHLGFYPIEFYGMTECGHVGITPIDEYLNTNSIPKVGRFEICRDKKIRITNYDNWDDLPMNTPGEITIFSQANMTCYLNDEETTNEVLHNGWFKTGDIGYLDENGYLYVTGRKKLNLIYDGYNINLEELEAILCEHENINEACVTSVKDDHNLEVPVTYIVLKNPDNDHEKVIEQVLSYLKSEIADYKIPERIKILSKLPRFEKNGKIDRQLLSKKAVEEFDK